MKTPAHITYDQLGGARFRTMTGANNIFHDDDGYTLRFRLPGRLKKKINFCKITLTPMDLYRMEFGRINTIKAIQKGKAPYEVIEVHDDLFNDMLVEFFEDATGLYTSF